ncbi:Crp/Fnr family transcriptional regulator [Methylocella sp.]|uniref:Crp/Fnr family transcriptional regulator n=1 Tax=Methylocella sp. TaxID=1978226 RepID=UPI0035B4560F
MAEPPDLSAFALFGRLDPADAAALAPLLRRRAFCAGRVLFQRGDPSNEALFVARGRLRVSVSSTEGREVAFRVAGPGETIGEIGVLDGRPRSADVCALSDGEALALSAADLARLLAARPSLALGVVAFLCARLREASEQLESVALKTVEARLARLLLRLAEASGPAGGRARLALRMTQSEVAALIGASRPKTSLAFGALVARGALRREGKALDCRLAALREIADA